MKAKPIQFARGITIAELNQFNHALKNDYVNNLLSTAFKVFPFIDKSIDDIRIVNGFVSEAHAKALGMVNNDVDKSFTNGTAIEFTWAEYNPEQAIMLFRKVMDEMPPAFELLIKENSIIILNRKSDKLITQEIKNSEGILSNREILRK